MTKSNHDIGLDDDNIVVSGETLDIEVIVVEDDGSAKDLTNDTITVYIGDSFSDDTALIQKDNDGSDVNITDATNGEFNATITSTETADLSGNYVWEAKVVDSTSGKVGAVCRGKLYVHDGFTDN